MQEKRTEWSDFLQKNLHFVDFVDTNVANTAYLVRCKEFDGACAGVVIEVERDAVVVTKKFTGICAGGAPDNQVDRVRTKEHCLGC